MSNEIFLIFEGSCPNCQGKLTKVRIECHPDDVEMWNGDVTANENLARTCPPQRGATDWSPATIYQCECQSCDSSFYLEQRIDGDWSM